jgi:hypothetical protein
MYEGAVSCRLNDHTFLCMEVDSFFLKNQFLFGPFNIKSIIYTVYFLNVESRIFNCLNTELNPVCHLLALLGANHILHLSR